MALRDTLKAASAGEADDERFEAEKPELIERWQASIISLHGQISNWLAEFVLDGALDIEVEEIELREDLLDSYLVQVMTLRAGKRVVRIQPIARIIIGAVGRVDMYRQGFANSNDRYRLIRTVDNTEGSWHIRMPFEAGREPAELLPATRETFEAALDKLMS